MASPALLPSRASADRAPDQLAVASGFPPAACTSPKFGRTTHSSAARALSCVHARIGSRHPALIPRRPWRLFQGVSHRAAAIRRRRQPVLNENNSQALLFVRRVALAPRSPQPGKPQEFVTSDERARSAQRPAVPHARSNAVLAGIVLAPLPDPHFQSCPSSASHSVPTPLAAAPRSCAGLRPPTRRQPTLCRAAPRASGDISPRLDVRVLHELIRLQVRGQNQPAGKSAPSSDATVSANSPRVARVSATSDQTSTSRRTSPAFHCQPLLLGLKLAI